MQMKRRPQFDVLLIPLPGTFPPSHLFSSTSSSLKQWPITQHAGTDTCKVNIINQYQWNCVEGRSQVSLPAVPISLPLNLICKPKMAAWMTGSKVFPTNFMGHEPKIIGFQPNDNPITTPIKADSMQANYQLQPSVQILTYHFLFE